MVVGPGFTKEPQRTNMPANEYPYCQVEHLQLNMISLEELQCQWLPL
jgi:hypothetical protein